MPRFVYAGFVEEEDGLFKIKIHVCNWPKGVRYQQEHKKSVPKPKSSPERLIQESLMLNLMHKLNGGAPTTAVMCTHFTKEDAIADQREFGILGITLLGGKMVSMVSPKDLTTSGIDLPQLERDTGWAIIRPGDATSLTVRTVMDEVYSWTKKCAETINGWRPENLDVDFNRVSLKELVYDYGRIKSGQIAFEILVYWGIYANTDGKSRKFTVSEGDTFDLTPNQCLGLAWKLLICGRYTSEGMANEVSLTLILILTLNLTPNSKPK